MSPMYARTKGTNNKDQNYDHFDNSNNNTSIYSAAEQAEWTIQSYKTMYEESKIGGGRNSDRYTTTAPSRPTPNDDNLSIHNIYDINSSNGSSSYNNNNNYNNDTNINININTNHIRGDEQFKLSRDSTDSNNSNDSIHHSIYNTNTNNNKVYNNAYFDTSQNQNTTSESPIDAYNTTYNNTTTTHSNTDFSKDSLDITTASTTAGARRNPSTSTMLSAPLSSLPPPPTASALATLRKLSTLTIHPAQGAQAVMDSTTAPASSSLSKRISSVGIAYTTNTTTATVTPQQSGSSRGSVGGGLIPNNKAHDARKSVFLTQDESEEFSSTIQRAATHRMSVQYYDSKYGSDDRSSADATNNSDDRSRSDVGRENTAHILSANDAYNISHNSSSRNSYSSTGDEADCRDDGGDDESDVTPPPYAYESHFDEFMMTAVRPDSDVGLSSNTITSAYAASGLRGTSFLESNWTAVLPSQAEAKTQSYSYDNNQPFLQPSASPKALGISLHDIYLSSTTNTSGYKTTNTAINYTNSESKISSPTAEAKSTTTNTARASSNSPRVPVVVASEGRGGAGVADEGEMELYSDSKAYIEVTEWFICINIVYLILWLLSIV